MEGGPWARVAALPLLGYWRSWGTVGHTLSSAADAAGLGGIAGFGEGSSLQDPSSIGQGARRRIPNAGKESAHPQVSVEIDV